MIIIIMTIITIITTKIIIMVTITIQFYYIHTREIHLFSSLQQ